MDKEVLKEFFMSKGFLSIVTILATQFGSQELADTLGYGVSFGQQLATTGLLGGVALGVWSRFGSAQTKVEAKKLETVVEKQADVLDKYANDVLVEREKKIAARLKAKTAEEKIAELEDKLVKTTPARVKGKFVKKTEE